MEGKKLLAIGRAYTQLGWKERRREGDATWTQIKMVYIAHVWLFLRRARMELWRGWIGV